MGTWIETILKEAGCTPTEVVPLVGTWIETDIPVIGDIADAVVPLVGTWIETCSRHSGRRESQRSFPSWERGLKLRIMPGLHIPLHVVPLVGTWIETPRAGRRKLDGSSRSPRGNVD